MRTLYKVLLISISLNFTCITSSYSQTFSLQLGVFPSYSISDIEWADYDDDGDLDYLIYCYTGAPDYSYYIKVYDNDGNENFSEVASILSPYGGNSISWIDINNDKNLDILHVSSGLRTSNGVEIYLNNGNKVFNKISENFINEYDGNNAVGDINNDGYPDIIYQGHENNKTYIYLNNGNSSFSQLTNHTIMGLCYGSIDLSDFDGNGYKDILISGTNFLDYNAYTKVYKNNGDSSFTELAYFFTGVTNSSGIRGTPSKWVDFDKDGNIDIAIVGNEYIHLYKNNGSGSFNKLDSILVTNIKKGSIALGDYDGDGDLDILVSGESNSKTSKVFKNNGGESFEEETNISLSDEVNGITNWIDYDGDGDLDIVLKGLLYRNERLENSLNDKKNTSVIKLYPNPINEHLYISGELANCEITICDLAGKVYYKTSSTGGQIKLSVSQLKNGIYLLHLSNGINQRVLKFIKN